MHVGWAHAYWWAHAWGGMLAGAAAYLGIWRYLRGCTRTVVILEQLQLYSGKAKIFSFLLAIFFTVFVSPRKLFVALNARNGHWRRRKLYSIPVCGATQCYKGSRVECGRETFPIASRVQRRARISRRATRQEDADRKETDIQESTARETVRIQ